MKQTRNKIISHQTECLENLADFKAYLTEEGEIKPIE